MASTASSGEWSGGQPGTSRTYCKEPHPTPHHLEICISCIFHSAANVNFMKTLDFHILSHLGV